MSSAAGSAGGPSAAPAAASQPSSSAPSAPSSTPPNAGAFDYKKAFDTQSAELRQVVTEFGRFKEQATRDSSTLGKIKEVFAPSPESQGDPVLMEAERMLDYYIAQGVDAEKRGQPMPLTINNGITMYKQIIEQRQREVKQERELKELRDRVKELSDPQVHINQRAYETLDSHIKRQIETIYGPGKERMPQKRALFKAIGEQLADPINEMMRQDPGEWDMLRRDPEALRAMADQFVRKNIPPKALELLAQDQLRNTEMPMSELRKAMQEAKVMIKDPREREEIISKIRQEILVRGFNNRRRQE